MQSVKKSPSPGNNENEERIGGEQEFQRRLKLLNKVGQEKRKASKRHEYFHSAREEMRIRKDQAAKRKKTRK